MYSLPTISTFVREKLKPCNAQTHAELLEMFNRAKILNLLVEVKSALQDFSDFHAAWISPHAPLSDIPHHDLSRDHDQSLNLLQYSPEMLDSIGAWMGCLNLHSLCHADL